MTERFQILSLDGGGIKGIFSAAVLSWIEEDYQTSIVDHFDLIVGTSTGGIIALGLGIGLTPKQILDFYLELGPALFRNPLGYRNLVRLFLPKYSQASLREALRDEKVFGDKTLGDSQKRLVIPAFDLARDDVYLFKTPHHNRLARDWNLPLWKIALATASAPTYFPVTTEIDGIRHVDGGVWSNNPVLVGIAEATSVLRVSLQNIAVLSLGTSRDVKHRPSGLDCGGLLVWARHAIDVVMNAQSTGANTTASHLLGERNLIRVNPEVPANLFKMDGHTQSKDLVALAASESRHAAPRINNEFLTHSAEHYEASIDIPGKR